MSPNIIIVDPTKHYGWDDLLYLNENHSIWHTKGWAKVISESYGYKPLYLTIIKNGRLVLSFPVMEVKGCLVKRRGVSLPFSDYCDPIIPYKKIITSVIEYLFEYGKERRWKYIELRGIKEYPQELPMSHHYYNHTLELSEDENKILSKFRDSTRRNIKKAFKSNVKIEICSSLNSIIEFYKLNCITRRRHGLPPQPLNFFKKLHEHIISKNSGFVILASHGGKYIAGKVFLHTKDRAYFKFGASDLKYQILRANNLVMWEAIKHYCHNGMKSLCLGKTDVENRGLLQHKRGWGAVERIIKYYKYDLDNNSFVKDHSKIMGWHNNVFNKMPIPLLILVGKNFYRYMG